MHVYQGSYVKGELAWAIGTLFWFIINVMLLKQSYQGTKE